VHGHNAAFTGAPFQYVSRYAINHLAMKVYGEKDAYDFDDAPRFDERGRPIPGQYSAYSNRVNQAKGAIELAKEGYFDLEPMALEGRTTIFLRYVVPGQYAPAVAYGGLPRGADPAIRAYWLGYLMPGLQGAGKARIPFVDLPKGAPAHPLMMTGSMNGCSLVVTQHPGDPSLLRVYHDSVHGRDTFKDDIVYARIDYQDELYASANRAAAARAATPASVRPRSASLGGGGAPSGGSRPRSASVSTAAVDPIPCVRYSYGDAALYEQVHSGSAVSGIANTDVKVRVAFNFLYFDAGVGKWTAVSQPLETQPTSAQPVKAWYERQGAFEERQKAFRRKGTQVAMPPSRPPWQAVIPY
jgi:hypothetical protein